MLSAEGLSVNEERPKDYLLHKAGRDVQRVFETLTDPLATALPAGDQPLARALRMLDAHFLCKVNHTFERHVFRKMEPRPGESVASFHTRLQAQARLCDLGDREQELITDQIIGTMTDVELQKRLLATEELTLAACLEQCKLHEATNAHARKMARSLTSTDSTIARVYGTNNTRSTPTTGKCNKCNRTGHSGGDAACPAKNRVCRACNVVGHFAVCCRKSGKTSFKNRQDRSREKTYQKGPQKAHAVQEQLEDSDEFVCGKIVQIGKVREK